MNKETKEKEEAIFNIIVTERPGDMDYETYKKLRKENQKLIKQYLRGFNTTNNANG